MIFGVFQAICSLLFIICWDYYEFSRLNQGKSPFYAACAGLNENLSPTLAKPPKDGDTAAQISKTIGFSGAIMDQFGTVTTPANLGFDEERLDRIPEFFSTYLDSKKFSGLSTLIARGDEIAHFSCQGVQDWDTGAPITPDTIFRIYSMTKPITSVVIMQLFEEGKLRLEHELHRYIPAFKDTQVWESGTWDDYTTKPAERPILIRDLLSHTSGLTYDFMMQHPVDKLYRKNGLAGARAEGLSAKEFVDRAAELPLLFSPGTGWNYSISTDVLGRVIEVIEGEPLDKVFKRRIFDPLGMVDTDFHITEDKLDRFATCYDKYTGTVRVQDKPETSPYLTGKDFLSGGGGLVSTMRDYLIFCRMVAKGGIHNGVRILSPRTVDLMRVNHLEGDKTMLEMGDSAFTEVGLNGTGFGLGFSVLMDQAAAMTTTPVGTYSWGGAASTFFWIDPVEDIVGLSMTQLMPSSTYPIRAQLQQLTYAALMDSNEK